MIVIHATKKLRDRVRADPPADDEVSTGLLGNWYANVLFVRPQLVLFVSETTLVPPLAPAAGLLDRFPAALGDLLAAHRLPQAFIDRELAAADELRLAPTANRSVLGVMNEFAHLARHYRRDSRIPQDVLEVSLDLAQTPTSPLRDGHGFPDRELQALAAQHGLRQAPSTRS